MSEEKRLDVGVHQGVITLCTILAVIAFAGNSVLCRMALGDGAIDAASFTTIRLLSGIIVLFFMFVLHGKKSVKTNSASTDAGEVKLSKGSWRSACYLFVYAAAFSYGYISLETGVGALVLFSTVQITMLLVSLVRGDKLHVTEWLGMVVAFVGFFYLVLPNLSTPSFSGFILMMFAGIGWALYTLAGRGAQNPTRDTFYNFFRTLPLIIVFVLITLRYAVFTPSGVLLAVLSGGIASGVGYTIWYIALRGLKTSQAAVVQLLVPVVAVLGGLVFANETLTLRFIQSAVMILGGILIVILGKRYANKRDLKL